MTSSAAVSRDVIGMPLQVKDILDIFPPNYFIFLIHFLSQIPLTLCLHSSITFPATLNEWNVHLFTQYVKKSIPFMATQSTQVEGLFTLALPP